MEWRCRECDLTYDSAPELCACGSPDVGPKGVARPRISVGALGNRLFDPTRADRSLVRHEPYVARAFYVLLVVAVLMGFVFALQLLV